MKHVYSGKVRDIYEVGDDRLLMVTSDRVSAFDVVMNEPITHKGRVLTAMTAFWLDLFSDMAPSHLISVDPADFPEDAAQIPEERLSEKRPGPWRTGEELGVDGR